MQVSVYSRLCIRIQRGTLHELNPNCADDAAISRRYDSDVDARHLSDSPFIHMLRHSMTSPRAWEVESKGCLGSCIHGF